MIQRNVNKKINPQTFATELQSAFGAPIPFRLVHETPAKLKILVDVNEATLDAVIAAHVWTPKVAPSVPPVNRRDALKSQLAAANSLPELKAILAELI